MNKKLLASMGIITVLILGGFGYLLMQDDKEPTQSQTTPAVENTEQDPAPESPAPAQAGVYTAYDESAVRSTQGTKLLFFHAPWCPQCRAIEESINTSVIPAGVTIFKIDYDTNRGLRQKYGVTLQTTFVKVDDQGNLLEKYVAYDEPTFASVKEHLL